VLTRKLGWILGRILLAKHPWSTNAALGDELAEQTMEDDDVEELVTVEELVVDGG
jgi:hypothetical protein